MFNTTESVPRAEGKVRPLAALKRLARKLNVEIKFASRPWNPMLPSPKPGETQAAYDPGSEFLTSPEGRRIREAVITKKPAKILRAKGAMAAEDVGKPQVTYKVLRPLGEGKVQPYSAPKGKAWIPVHRTEIQRGEKFHEQPTYERNRLNWKTYVRAHAENQIEGERKRLRMEGVSEPIEETRTRLHKQLTQKFLGQTQELYTGERMGKRQLRAATIRHIEGMMKRDREYMAGGLRQSRAIIHARGVDPLLARSHPERMIEYKKRLGTLTPLRQAETKSARGFIVDQLHDIATRGSSVVAEEKDADWMIKRDKLHLHRQMLANPEYGKMSGLPPEKIQEKVADADKALEEHFSLRKTKAEIRDQAKGTVGLLADKPVSHGGSPLSKESAETIADILQKGNKSGKPITVEHVHRIKGHLDDLYERSASSGVQGVQKELLASGNVFKRPAGAIRTGYPHLGKLGLGLGIAASIAGGLAVRHAVKKRQERQMSNRGRLIQFAKKFGDLPEEAKKILDAAVNQASLQGWKESERAIPNIVRSKRLRRRQALTKLKRKWGGEFLQKILAHPELPTHPNAPSWRKMFEHQKSENVMLRRQQVTHAHIRSEALKQQEEILGAQGKERAREEYSRGVGTGREQAKASAQAHYEQKAGQLAESLGEESNKRAARLKWIAGGTLGAGAIGGYALGRHDKQAHQRHEAMMILNRTRPQPRTPRPVQQQPTITIGISGVNGTRRKNVQFQANDKDDEGPDWLQKWAHRKLYGRDYSTLGQAQKVKKYAGRTHRLVRDINIKRQGLPNLDPRGRPRKNEWEKPWVTAALYTGAIGATIFGGKKAIKFIREADPQSRIGQFVEGFKRGNIPGVKAKGFAKVGAAYHGIGEELKRWRDKPLKGAVKYEHSKFDPVTGKMKSATQLEREAKHMSNIGTLEEIAARRKIHPWEKGTGEKGFSSILKEIRFQRRQQDQEPAPAWHDIATGSIEGGLGFVGTERLLKKVGERYPIMEKAVPRFATAAVGGGITTGAIGYALNRLIRKKVAAKRAAKQEQLSSRLRLIRFQDPYYDEMMLPKTKSQRTMVARDRYMKQIHERDIARADRLYKHAALIGAGIGALATKKPSKLLRSAGIGAAIGVGTQKAVRLYGQANRDPFGERTVHAKRVEEAPEVLGTAVLAGYGLKRLSKHFSARNRLIRFEEQPQRKHRFLAGLAVAATGIPLYRGAGKFARIGLRSRIDKLAGKPMNYGKQVADYLEASQHILNQGVTGKVTGAALRHPESGPVKWAIGKSPKIWDVGTSQSGIHPSVLEHYSAFRHSPASALDSWHKEAVAEWRGRKNPGVVKELNQGRKVLNAHLQDLRFRGYNEREALREATKEPLHANYFRRLIAYKGNPVKNYQRVTAGLAAVPATAGAAVAATTKKDQTRASVR